MKNATLITVYAKFDKEFAEEFDFAVLRLRLQSEITVDFSQILVMFSNPIVD